MTQEPPKLINLAVHESSDPSVISPTPHHEASADLNDLNDSTHDDKNVDVPNPDLFDATSDENIANSQISIANLSAG